ncbi:phosphotransferase enzyme family protein [Colletotrichum orchidophilum]|uniref:Phosphotransferase enzyme family protein n=1 Tax=Colletotrichum orchidophilum TaxID=1209926 RepID=A0A1G4BQV1_9PEZI|nr:phosphotransferase enzyme family protein [Colletotrichum orchidophilum]OHF03790.1 phosphotransferase enzyme family protein [Colletotrichum orchidophilum]
MGVGAATADLDSYSPPQTTTCFDTFEDTNSNDQARSWIRKALDAQLDLAKFVADRRGKGRATEIVGYLKGSFNLGFRIRFEDDGPDAIIRFPKPGHISTVFLEGKLVNEVRAIEFIRHNTTIPVPFLHAWGMAHESPRQLGPFIIMDFVEGTLASRILQKPTDDDQEELILNPDLDSSLLDKFYRQVAGYLLQLSRLKFKRIGAISKEPREPGEEEDAWSSSKRPLTYNMNELATAAGYPTDSFPTTSFARASDLFKSVGHEHLVHLRTQRNLAFTPEIARARYIARHRYLQLVNSYCSAEDDAGPFAPYCDDLRPANMLVDPDTMRITAVLDWEFTNAMPAQFSHEPPWWLLLTDPGSWVDRDAVQEFRDLYEPRMKQFLRMLETVEAEEGRDACGDGDGNDRRPLSARMGASWVTGQFWFNFASRKSYDVDNIYWRVLHDGGDAAELLDPEVRAGMDAAVEEKMAQLREYREEYAVRFPDEEADDHD